MRGFQDTFETSKRSFIGAFSICMTVSLKVEEICRDCTDLIFCQVAP